MLVEYNTATKINCPVIIILVEFVSEQQKEPTL